MEKQEILQVVEKIFQEVFDNSELNITIETVAQDIEEWDSLEQINIIMMLEQQFHIKFSLAEVSQITNIKEMVKVIKDKL